MGKSNVTIKFWTITAVFFLLFSSVAPAFAYTQKDIEENQEKQAANEAEQSAIQKQIDVINAKQVEVDDQVAQISSDAAQAEQQVNEINLQIQEIEREIAALEDSIAELEQEIIERNEIIKGRMVAVQEAGGQQTYLEVIFGATSFGNFIERTTTISAIIQSDQELIAEQAAAIEEYEYAKEETDILLEELNTTKASLEEQQKAIEAELDKQLATAAELEQQSDEVHSYAVSLEEEQEILEAQEAAMKKAMTLPPVQPPAAPAPPPSSDASEEQPAEGDKPESPAPPSNVSEKGFIDPCPGYLTSAYGPRGGGFHHGIDIGNSSMGKNTPVYAAADGVVSKAYESTSYGNCVMIVHNTVNGPVTTVYAHLDDYFVKEGQVVQQGQQIGTMGETGQADGIHLHYEVYEGEWTSDHSNSVDPIANGYCSY